MEKETKHTPEWKLSQTFPWIVITENGSVNCLTIKNAELIASAPTLKAENERLKLLSEQSTSISARKVWDLETELSEMKKGREELKRTINGIYLMDGMIGRRGCTYSDTEYDSLSVAYGYNECLDHVKEWIDRIKK